MFRNLQSRRAKGLLVAVIGLAIALVVALSLLPSGDREQADEAAKPPVEVAEVVATTLRDTVRGIGTLRAPTQVTISPEVSGRVQAVHFREGSVVEEGELLLELTTEKLRSQLAASEAAVRSAEVRLANARRVYERQKSLVEDGLVSDEEFEAVRAEYDSAGAELERVRAERNLTREQLEDTEIHAPFTGAISERMVDQGAYISAGSSVAQLYQMDPLELSFSVPERFLGRVKRGQTVQVSLAAYSDKAFIGELSFISPAVDESTRTLAVKADIPNPELQLSPGGFATGVVTVDERHDRPVVPNEALVGTRTGFILYVVEDGVARSRQVSTGLRREGLVEITEGVSPGEQIVRSGHMRISDGTEVEVERHLPVQTGSEAAAELSPE